MKHLGQVPWKIICKSVGGESRAFPRNCLGFYPLPMVDFPWDFRYEYECLFAEGQLRIKHLHLPDTDWMMIRMGFIWNGRENFYTLKIQIVK